MARKRSKFAPRSFESAGYYKSGDNVRGDVSANIFQSMLISAAWEDLTKNQQLLYVYCKSCLFEQKQKPAEIPGDVKADECFYFHKSIWCDKFHLYRENNQAAFIKDMQALIYHGFVACVSDGSVTRQKTIYRYSAMWRKWGTDDFNIPDKDKTLAMLRSEKRKKKLTDMVYYNNPLN